MLQIANKNVANTYRFKKVTTEEFHGSIEGQFFKAFHGFNKPKDMINRFIFIYIFRFIYMILYVRYIKKDIHI